MIDHFIGAKTILDCETETLRETAVFYVCYSTLRV